MLTPIIDHRKRTRNIINRKIDMFNPDLPKEGLRAPKFKIIPTKDAIFTKAYPRKIPDKHVEVVDENLDTI